MLSFDTNFEEWKEMAENLRKRETFQTMEKGIKAEK
jgi:hypothetical protein